MDDADLRRDEEEAPDKELEPADAAEQDFGARNVIMSNALQGGASPAVGGVTGSGGELGMQPQTDEEILDEEGEEGLPPHETRERRRRD